MDVTMQSNRYTPRDVIMRHYQRNIQLLRNERDDAELQRRQESGRVYYTEPGAIISIDPDTESVLRTRHISMREYASTMMGVDPAIDPKNRKCPHCGEGGFHQGETHDGMKLFDADELIHECMAEQSKKSMADQIIRDANIGDAWLSYVRGA